MFGFYFEPLAQTVEHRPFKARALGSIPRRLNFPSNIEELMSLCKNNIWLAPMAGFTNFVFRKMCLDFGAGQAFSEMISIEGIVRNNLQSLVYPEETKIGIIQIFGGDEKIFYKVGRFLTTNFGLTTVDVNFGCPVKKVLKSKAGGYLLNFPEKMADIIKALKDSGLNVYAKIRAGFSEENLENIIPVIDKAGVDVITLHARLATQFYSGVAKLEYILKARSLTNKFLVANGDIKTPEDIIKVLQTTKANAVMLGRIALEKPYIFKMAIDYLKNGEYKEPSYEEKKRMIFDYTKNYIESFKKERIVEIRGILLHLIKGFPFAKELRDKIAKIDNFNDFLTVIEEMDRYKT